MGSLEEILERVQYKFASIIGELCGEPLALSQFAIWVDLRLAEYKLKGSISLDCSGQRTDPEWLRSIKTIPCSSDCPPSSQSAVLPRNNSKHLPPNAASVNHVNLNSRNVSTSVPFSSPPPRLEKRPPYARSTQPPIAHMGPIVETVNVHHMHSQDGEETNSFPGVPEILNIKKERPEQIHDFEVTRSHLNSPLLEGKKRSLCNGPSSAGESTHLHSSSKFARIEDGPPPLKPLIENPAEAYLSRNFRQLSPCNLTRSLTVEGDQECEESDSEFNGSDIPEDLSMSSTKNQRNQNSIQPSWSDQSINGLEPPASGSVLHSFGRSSCLSNGPKFTEQWRQFVTNRSINLKSMSAERYQGYMDLLKVAQSKVHVPKSVKEHKMLYKFDLWRDDTSERLIKKRHKDTDPVRFYISDDQLFHALLAVHLDSGHGGIKKMLTLCKERYANITADAVKLFNHLCYNCQTRKRPMPPKIKDQSESSCPPIDTDPPLVNTDTTLSNSISTSSSSAYKSIDPT